MQDIIQNCLLISKLLWLLISQSWNVWLLLTGKKKKKKKSCQTFLARCTGNPLNLLGGDCLVITVCCFENQPTELGLFSPFSQDLLKKLHFIWLKLTMSGSKWMRLNTCRNYNLPSEMISLSLFLSRCAWCPGADAPRRSELSHNAPAGGTSATALSVWPGSCSLLAHRLLSCSDSQQLL